VFLALVPRGQTIQRVSRAAKLPGLALPGRRDLSVMPYVVGRSTRDLALAPVLEDDSADLGGDLKWGITPQLTLDLTVNTDFAQVEADDEQINLTRYELFFPEKRPFFLENASLFQLGQPQQIDFFSRAGSPGHRLLGTSRAASSPARSATTNVALLDMQTAGARDRVPRAWWRLPAIRRGARPAGARLPTSARSRTGWPPRGRPVACFNRAYGVDATVPIGRYGSCSRSPPPPSLPIRRRRLPAELHTLTGPVGRPRRRQGRQGTSSPRRPCRRSFGPRRIAWNSPQFRKLTFIRRATPHVSWNTFYGLDGTRQTTFLHVHLADFALTNGGRIAWSGTTTKTARRPASPYQPRVGERGRPAGAIRATRWRCCRATEPPASAKVVPNAAATTTATTTPGTSGGVRSGGKFQATLQYVRESYRLPGGDFTTELLPFRVSWSFTPRMSIQALVQYNGVASQIGTNVRFAWLLRSGTGLFVVYNDRRDTARQTPETILGRSLIVKFSRLVDF
jgi:hypothetical protein